MEQLFEENILAIFLFGNYHFIDGCHLNLDSQIQFKFLILDIHQHLKETMAKQIELDILHLYF